MGTLFANALINVAYLCLTFGIVYGVMRLVFKYTPPAWVWKACACLVAVSAWWNLTSMNGPRFVLSDESRPAPVVAGEVKDTRPTRLTDSEREARNQELYEQNQRSD